MKISRPSPALIVSIVALVVACAGTATAASVLIRNSSQLGSNVVTSTKIQNNQVQSADIRNGTIRGVDVANGTISPSKLSSALRSQITGVGPSAGLSAQESVRRSGPENQNPGSGRIVTVPQVAPGTYLVLAKTTVTGVAGDLGLGELLRPNKTAGAECTLALGADVDKARQPVATPGSEGPSTVNMQLTRTIDTPTDATLDCAVNDIKWRASDSSIVLVKLSGATRVDTAG